MGRHRVGAGIQHLCERCTKVRRASRLGLSFEDFACTLAGISRAALPDTASEEEERSFLEGLSLRELALAQACSKGSLAAWECFTNQYYGRVQAAALSISGDPSVAAELVQSLWADLFCSSPESRTKQDGKLASYNGRGSLEAWLKAILAHAYIDRYRARQREVSFDEGRLSLRASCFPRDLSEGEVDGRIGEAVTHACLQRKPEERFMIACYFFDNWTLAEIARALHVHESTISRRIDRLLRELRKSVKRYLRDQGFSSRQIEEVFETDIRRISFDLRGRLLETIRLAEE